jgi:hypothetical protein
MIGAIPTPQDAVPVPAPKEAEPQIGQEDFSFKKAWKGVKKLNCGGDLDVCKGVCVAVCPSDLLSSPSSLNNP